MPPAFPPSPARPAETALDGVRYVTLAGEGGETRRLASVAPDWAAELPLLERAEDPEVAARLADRGIWVGRGKAPPLAVMCCGLGSAWPGMGRELYDGFPAAREAMDRIAAAADWDVLGLMDETDAGRISHIRWQQPYCFLVEYAQWSVLRSLGVRPAVLCGHSLGEIIALCLAGVYSPEVAWYIMDTRAEHMGELEAVRGVTGMMAVHAGIDVVEPLLERWPQLCISNHNTPTQFILSGPRDVLAEVRTHLRKLRIPAIVLNIGRAFHHPDMIIMRHLAHRRLRALEVHPPVIPVIAGEDASFYPNDVPSVCRRLMDLDERPVLWSKCVRTLWERDGVRHFVEMGPQDTLCGLVAENRPEAACWPAGRKGQEAGQMRRLCAMLHAAGHCDAGAIRTLAARPRPSMAPRRTAAVRDASFEPSGEAGKVFDAVRHALAAAVGRRPEELGAGDDLRHDLGLKSSRFPLVVQDLEARLGRPVTYENLAGVVTLADLVRALASPDGQDDRPREGQTTEDATDVRDVAAGRPPLCRFAHGTGQDGKEEAPIPFDPGGPGVGLLPGHRLLLRVFPVGLLWALVRSLVPYAAQLIVPAGRAWDCLPAAMAAERLMSLDIPAASDASAASVAASLAGLEEPCEGLVAVFSAESPTDAAIPWLEAMRTKGMKHAFLARLGDGGKGWERERLAAAAGNALLRTVDCRGIDAGDMADMADLGDMLIAEIMRGTAPSLTLARVREGGIAPERAWVHGPGPQRVFPGSHGRLAGRTMAGTCHFSGFLDGALAKGRLPLDRALSALATGAAIGRPWCRVTGFSDLRFGEPPQLFPGVTRECRVDVAAGLWLMQDGTYTRMCRSRLAVNQLTESGRRTGRMAQVASGMVLLAAEPGHPEAFLPLPDPKLAPDGQACGEAAEGDAQTPGEGFPEGCGAIAEGNAVCREVIRAGEERWQAHIGWGEDKACGVMADGNGNLARHMRLVGACVTAMRIVLDDAAAWERAAWRLAQAGFVRLAATAGTPMHRAVLVRTWNGPDRVRFDAQVCDGAGEVVLTLHHMEFIRQTCDGADQADGKAD